MNSIADVVKSIYVRLSKTTRSALIVLLIVIPDWVSRGGFWYSSAVASWPSLRAAYASPYGKLSLIVLAFLLIWLDQRRITRQKAEPHGPFTLKDRTLQLRDQMQAFLDGLGPMPEGFMGTSQVRAGPDWRSPGGPMHNSAIVRATGPLSQRIAKVDYGYELYFAAPLLQIYNEFGFRGVIDKEMKDLLFKQEQYNREAALRDTVQALSRLAELEEATYPD
jgi:hypothetical protein